MPCQYVRFLPVAILTVIALNNLCVSFLEIFLEYISSTCSSFLKKTEFPSFLCKFLIFVSKEGELQVIHKDTKRKLGSCNLNQKVYSSIESYENKVFIQVSDGSLRAYTIKKNGNPDELWNKPFFTEENDKRNNEEWDPAC